MAVEAIKGQRTTSEIAQTFAVHPNLGGSWKKQVLELLPKLLVTPPAKTVGAADPEKEEPCRLIG